MIYRKLLLGLLITAIFAIGIYNSYQATFYINEITSDSTYTAVMWQGIKEYGWVFLKSWFYNSDTFIFSLFPWHFLIFSIIGDSPRVLLWLGYLIFLGNLAICSWIAYRLKARWSAIIVPLLLLFCNFFTYLGGYVTFNICHNISTLFGLICILLVIEWLRKPHYIFLIVIFLLTVIAGLSDPWFIPAFACPILLTQLLHLIIFKEKQSSSSVPLLLGALFIGFLVITTNVFGFLQLIKPPSIPLAPPKDLIKHLFYFPKVAGWLFYLIPGRFTLNRFFNLSALIPFIIIFILTLTLFIKIRKQVLSSTEQFNFFLIILLSILLIFGSYCLLRMNFESTWYIKSSRYLINILFLLILGVTVAVELYWQDIGKTLKILWPIVGLLYVASSLSSTLYLWTRPINLKDNESYLLADFLAANHLTYGYADYWSANVISYFTNNKIKVRPVYFDTKDGNVTPPNFPGFSKLWFKSSDLPADQKEYFIIVQKIYYGCPDEQKCIATLSSEFGPPEKILVLQNKEGKDYVVVWDHPLLEQMFKQLKKPPLY